METKALEFLDSFLPGALQKYWVVSGAETFWNCQVQLTCFEHGSSALSSIHPTLHPAPTYTFNKCYLLINISQRCFLIEPRPPTLQVDSLPSEPPRRLNPSCRTSNFRTFIPPKTKCVSSLSGTLVWISSTCSEASIMQFPGWLAKSLESSLNVSYFQYETKWHRMKTKDRRLSG